MKEFTKCDRCQTPIFVGDKLVSLVLSNDFVESSYSIQPLEAHEISSWCTSCAPIAIQEATTNKKET